MITLKKTTRDPALQSTIDDIHAQMRSLNADAPEYAAMADQLVKLYQIKDENALKSVNPDTLIAAVANLAGILLIVNHEHVGIITTKALGFVKPLR